MNQEVRYWADEDAEYEAARDYECEKELRDVQYREESRAGVTCGTCAFRSEDMDGHLLYCSRLRVFTFTDHTCEEARSC